MKQSQFPINPFINTAELFGLNKEPNRSLFKAIQAEALCEYCGYSTDEEAEDSCTCFTECLDCGQLGRDCVCPEDMSGATEGDR